MYIMIDYKYQYNKKLQSLIYNKAIIDSFPWTGVSTHILLYEVLEYTTC